MNSLLLIFAAVVVSTIPVVWFEFAKGFRAFSARRWSITAGLLFVLPGATGFVLVVVPFAPVIEWGQPGTHEIGLILATSPLLWGLAVLIGIFSKLTGVAIQAADIDPWEETDTEDTSGLAGPSPWLMVPLGSLVGGAEELLFRGIVLVWLVDTLGVAGGLVLNGVLFGLYHYPNSVESMREIDGSAIKEMSISGLGGIVLGILYLWTSNLLVPLAGHTLHNAGLFYYLYTRTDS